MTDLDALEQTALAEPTTQEGRILADFAFDQERGVFVGDYDEQGFRAAIVRIEQQAAAAAVREADALRGEPIDVDRLRAAMLEVVVNGALDCLGTGHAPEIAAEYAALSPTEPAE